MSKSPKLRLFAGPNGSGKTTLINQIGQDFSLGVFINADILEYELKKKKFLNLSELLGKPIPTQSSWLDFFENYRKLDTRSIHLNPDILNIKEGVLIWNGEMNSYIASIIAAFFRHHLSANGISFSFEIEHEGKSCKLS